MNGSDSYRDLPRGKERRGWIKELLEPLTGAAKDVGEVFKGVWSDLSSSG